jgi:type II secretory pathway component PulF
MVAWVLGLAIVWSCLVLVVPKFKEIFADFDSDLPKVTLMLIGLSDFAITPVGIGVFASAALGGIACFVLWPDERDGSSWISTGLVVAILGLILGVMVIGMFLPLVKLIQNVAP